MPALQGPHLDFTQEVFRVERITGPEPDRQPLRQQKVIAVMPAYNAELTLAATVADIPAGSVDEIILVDDGSRDRTVTIAKQMGLTVIQHERNKGYGGNQKT